MDTLEEAGDKLFTFTRVPPGQWKSIRTPNAIERLHEEFKRGSRRKPAAPRRDSGPAVPGAAPVRSDHRAEGRRLGKSRPKARRSNH
jgi:transposase-like protein